MTYRVSLYQFAERPNKLRTGLKALKGVCVGAYAAFDFPFRFGRGLFTFS